MEGREEEKDGGRKKGNIGGRKSGRMEGIKDDERMGEKEERERREARWKYVKRNIRAYISQYSNLTSNHDGQVQFRDDKYLEYFSYSWNLPICTMAWLS